MSCLTLLTTFVLVFVVVAASEAPLDSNLDASDDVLFQRFHSRFKSSKFSNDAEKSKRFNIFKANMAKIRSLNAKKTGGATFGINELSELSPEEFKKRGSDFNFDLNAIRNATSDEINFYSLPGQNHRVRRDTYPQNFDWRILNMITPVQNQQSCGSCWAFAAVAGIEAHYAIKNNGAMIGLSEQDLVDCEPTSHGCSGGLSLFALQYARDKGISLRSSYPYTNVQGSCKTINGNKTKIAGLVGLPMNDETAMRNFVANNGPVTVSMQLPSSWQFYTGGIMSLTLEQCEAQKVSGHAVIVVGYGVENGKNYWIAKNSWGTGWGEKGFIRFERDTNFCRMSEFSHAPVFDSGVAENTTSTTSTSTTTSSTTTTNPSTPPTTTTSKPIPPQQPGTCPVCAPLRTKTDQEIQADWGTGMAASCNAIKQMDAKTCGAQVACWGTKPSTDSLNIVLHKKLDGSGNEVRATYGTVPSVSKLICTPLGWTTVNSTKIISEVIECAADLPTDSTTHTCFGPAVTTPPPTPQQPGTCPICEPLRVLSNEEVAAEWGPAYAASCSSVKPMNNATCSQQVSCWGTKSSGNSLTLTMYQSANDYFRDTHTTLGTDAYVSTLVCTPRGWTIPMASDPTKVFKGAIGCVSTLPTGATKHTCS